LSARCQPVVFDGWRSISISLYMTLVGYAVLVGVPVISTAWVELLGFTPEQVDRTGAYASLMPGAQGLGQIVGPNIAASMLGAGMGYSKVFAVCATAAMVGLVIYGAMYLWLRRTIPALARAT